MPKKSSWFPSLAFGLTLGLAFGQFVRVTTIRNLKSELKARGTGMGYLQPITSSLGDKLVLKNANFQ